MQKKCVHWGDLFDHVILMMKRILSKMGLMELIATGTIKKRRGKFCLVMLWDVLWYGLQLRNDDVIFLQDNAPIHTLASTKPFLKDHEIKLEIIGINPRSEFHRESFGDNISSCIPLHATRHLSQGRNQPLNCRSLEKS